MKNMQVVFAGGRAHYQLGIKSPFHTWTGRVNLWIATVHCLETSLYSLLAQKPIVPAPVANVYSKQLPFVAKMYF